MTARRWATAAVLLALAACGGGDDSRTIRVLAAASLTDAFEELAGDFEADHPGVTLELSVGPSSALAAQVVEGAPADVLATADEATMQAVVDAGAVAGTPSDVARNVGQLAVPAGNPGGVRGIDDLDRDDLLV